MQVAHLQDGLVNALKGMSEVAHAARAVGVVDTEVDRFLLTAMFSTLTNVNFDAAYFAQAIPTAITLRGRLLAAYTKACAAKGVKPTAFSSRASWAPSSFDEDALERAGAAVGVQERKAAYGLYMGEEVIGMQELVTYGIKGACAYAAHAMEAGVEKEEIYAGLHEAMAALSRGEADLTELTGLALKVGSINVGVMGALDEAHVARFGNPAPTPVNHAPVAGKAILISGHDLADLEALLEQTEGQGVNVYTHGEMLPAHGYPGLKKYKHLVGHYGGAWQLQKMEYAAFPGPIVQSTNCLVEPRPSYKGRLYTTNSTGWPGVTHISHENGKRDFSAVILQAKSMEGFKTTKPAKMHLTGFGHAAVLSAAPAVIEAATKGDLKRIVLIGGCDGNESERSYYTKLATSLPDSAAILTLGCGKFRVLGKKEYGNIPNTAIPRVLDMGQCNDAYSAVVVAQALAKAFKTDVNGLPLSIVLSWFEQKAVAVLLSLLALGVRNIRIGPNLPAFVTPKTLTLLQSTFNIMPINAGAKDGDVDAVMGLAKMA